MPANPSAWRFRAIDQMRKGGRLAAAQDELRLVTPEAAALADDDGAPDDDQLRLIFACCHPALPPEGQVALTLRTVCGPTTEEITRAFLLRAPTLAQRIVRAKSRIREAGLRYEVPGPDDLPARLGPVLRVIYPVFNEGYAARSGDTMLRPNLSAEAIRLGRRLADLLPDAEVLRLLGLMLLHDARRAARMTPRGEVILLADQDRALWDAGLIAEGTTLVERAFASGLVGPYALQGAIAAVHMAAPTAAQTDWTQILGLHTVLGRIAPSPVVALAVVLATKLAAFALAARGYNPLIGTLGTIKRG